MTKSNDHIKEYVEEMSTQPEIFHFSPWTPSFQKRSNKVPILNILIREKDEHSSHDVE